MLLFQLCEMRVNRHPNPPFLIAAPVIFGQTSHQAAVCHVGPQSRVCLTTGKQVYADLCEVLYSQHTRSQTSMFGRVVLVVEAMNHREVRSCLIDGEAVCCDEKGGAAFQLLRHRRNEPRVPLRLRPAGAERHGPTPRTHRSAQGDTGQHPAEEPARRAAKRAPGARLRPDGLPARPQDGPGGVPSDLATFRIPVPFAKLFSHLAFSPSVFAKSPQSRLERQCRLVSVSGAQLCRRRRGPVICR